MRIRQLTLPVTIFTLAACGGSTPPPEKPAVSHTTTRTPPPEGPTRTDFQTIAQKLLGQCVAGGWISRWRSTAKDVDQAKPRILLKGFDDKTNQNLDPEYLNSQLEKRMRMSGVFDIAAQGSEFDFYGQGKLMRLAERNKRGDRVSVYTATLELIDPNTNKIAYSCEATVQGEL